jgi:hypothetical protein
LDAASRRTLGLAAGLVLAAGLLGAPLGVDAAAANCKLALQSGEASPGSGTTETVTTFSVRVSWKANCAEPDAVTLRILGLSGTTVLGQGSTSSAGARARPCTPANSPSGRLVRGAMSSLSVKARPARG